jgi:hypothetical protein
MLDKNSIDEMRCMAREAIKETRPEVLPRKHACGVVQSQCNTSCCGPDHTLVNKSAFCCYLWRQSMYIITADHGARRHPVKCDPPY